MMYKFIIPIVFIALLIYHIPQHRQDNYNSSTTVPQNLLTDVIKVAKVEYKNVTFSDEGYGYLKVIGEASNLDNQRYSFVTSKIIFYDEDEKILGTGDIVIENLPASGTKVWDTIVKAPSQKPNKYKIQTESSL